MEAMDVFQQELVAINVNLSNQIANQPQQQQPDKITPQNKCGNHIAIGESKWHNTRTIKDELKAFKNASDATNIAEAVLLELKYIELDPHTNNIRLTKLGRDNCSNAIKIPPSNVEKVI